MTKKTGLIVGMSAAVVTLLALISITIWQISKNNTDVVAPFNDYELSTMKQLATDIDYSQYDLANIIPANENSGNLPENILGNPDAPVIITEHMDYQCTSCAPMNVHVNKILEEYDGKVAFVLRAYLLPYHSSSPRVTSAANAAAIQGYWKDYKDLVFANQSEWYESEDNELQNQLEEYFVQVSNGKGDLKKFRADMASEAVAKKVAFDFGIGNEIEIGGTPWFYLDGEWIENPGDITQAQYADLIRKAIDKKLKTLE